MHALLLGLGWHDAALFLLRFILGGFFILARFRFFYDPSRRNVWQVPPNQVGPWFNHARHTHLRDKLHACGFGCSWGLTTWVAFVEVFGGLAIVFGFLSIPATLGVLVLLTFATFCTAKAKVLEQNPVDPIDCLSCYLWRVEGIYITIAIVLLMMGPGNFSVDAMLHAYLH